MRRSSGVGVGFIDSSTDTFSCLDTDPRPSADNSNSWDRHSVVILNLGAAYSHPSRARVTTIVLHYQCR
jgi:hypothetical protein